MLSPLTVASAGTRLLSGSFAGRSRCPGRARSYRSSAPSTSLRSGLWHWTDPLHWRTAPHGAALQKTTEPCRYSRSPVLSLAVAPAPGPESAAPPELHDQESLLLFLLRAFGRKSCPKVIPDMGTLSADTHPWMTMNRAACRRASAGTASRTCRTGREDGAQREECVHTETRSWVCVCVSFSVCLLLWSSDTNFLLHDCNHTLSPRNPASDGTRAS